ncbi:uncharacterized protein LOC134837952 [Culicoides brevitarsis]|uniref:uncharacterized protein LOC134837952 n=1 Tax=Culicoides brevitarsis TaxID=469753 RepID=UPI00307C5984
MEALKKKRPKSSKSAMLNERPKSKTGISPYDQNYRPQISHCQKHLIAMHLTVTKLNRSELEDKYLQLCDENYKIKHDNKDLNEKLKLLSTKIMRVSSASLTIRRFKSVDMLSQGSSNRENHEDCEDGNDIQKPNSKKEKRQVLKVKNELDRDQFLDGVLNVIQGGSQDIQGGKRVKAVKQSYIDRISELQQELETKKEECDEIRNKNFDLEVKLKEMDAKMFEETKKLVVANMEIKSIKRKAEKYELQVKHLKQERRELERKLETTIENEKKRYDDLRSTLDNEKNKIDRLVEQNEELEANRKQILMLKEQIIQLESEKSSLRVQQENFTKLVEESASYKAILEDLTSQNDRLRHDIAHEKSEQQVIFHSQELLLGKLQKLQDENDAATVENEGLKSKLEYYINENISLELRLRDVEQSKIELLQQIKKSQTAKVENRCASGKGSKENMKEKILTKLSTVTFEPWDSEVKIRSRTNSLSSKTSNGSKSQPKTLSKSESITSITNFEKVPVVTLQVPTPSKNYQSKKPPIKTNEIMVGENKIQDKSDLIARHCRDAEFFRDLSLIQQAIVNSSSQNSPIKSKQGLRIDFTLDDVTMTEDFTDMTPTKDSVRSNPGEQHDMSMQADIAANLLIKDIKKSVGIEKNDGKNI